MVVLLMVVFWRRPAAAPTSPPQAQPAPPTSLRLIASGDTIAHDAINNAAKQVDGTYNYYQFMKPMQPYFDKSAIRFCNQAVPSAGVEFGIRGYPVFNAPLEVSRDMQELGCNVINAGTNHTFDVGQSAIDAQLNYWDTLPDVLAVAGANRSEADRQKVRYFESHGIRFAFVAYSTYTNIAVRNTYGLTMYDALLAEQQISEARTKADIVLVSMRWGTEYATTVNAEQQAISQQLASWGADVILGHGPHVVQPVEKLNGPNGRTCLVWYSLGNFLNAQVPVESLVNGLAVMDIDIATKQLKEPAYLPIYMHYEWTAEQKAAEALLTRKNFSLVALDEAKELLARSQNNTTVQAQIDRLQAILNQRTPVELLTSRTY